MRIILENTFAYSVPEQNIASSVDPLWSCCVNKPCDLSLKKQIKTRGSVNTRIIFTVARYYNYEKHMGPEMDQIYIKIISFGLTSG